MKLAISLLAVLGCGGGMSPPMADDDAAPDAPTVSLGCPNGQAGKLKFAEATSCANDGSVEFCIPEADAQLRATLTAISSSIVCGPGGGRAGCLRTPGLLLCSYPTRFPTECTSDHGAMTPAVWADMCEIAGLPQIVEIVPTIFE